MSKSFNRADFESQRCSPGPEHGIGKPVLIICGEEDSVIIQNELMVDSSLALGGAGRMTFRTVAGGHDFPVSKSKQVVDIILEFWHPEERVAA